ncbi:hypothetical protein RFI_32188 [Reticulomyxa filosa]|uniref:Amino acid transporter transmembrane domain-containing protein n=1 Tax=Reticulomyxa filosa TaxID=46433 RepID=X6LU92_RETFI|nr:hypothetical protein RFI_32188 [Reticulomyxa filosa]|eukprot:ETO05209.1 hypothetical protein RFI_32188 [Reticulomyxa filosa]
MFEKDSTELSTWKADEQRPFLIEETSLPKNAAEEESSDENTNNSAIINQTKPFSENKQYYSLWIAGCFLVNYTVGAGVLDLPLHFYQSGYVQSSILLCVLSVLNYCGFLWVVNAMYRGEAITTIATQAGVKRDTILTDQKTTISSIKGISLRTFQKYYQLQRNEYQMNELMGIFCGRKWKIFYEVSFLIGMMATLWAYSVLFATSLTRVFGVSGISNACEIDSGDYACRNLYNFYVGVFWIWTILICLVNFSEQASFQVWYCYFKKYFLF